MIYLKVFNFTERIKIISEKNLQFEIHKQLTREKIYRNISIYQKLEFRSKKGKKVEFKNKVEVFFFQNSRFDRKII